MFFAGCSAQYILSTFSNHPAGRVERERSPRSLTGRVAPSWVTLLGHSLSASLREHSMPVEPHPKGESARSATATIEPTAGKDRACGSCSLCCTVLRVDEIAKLGGTPCQHLRPDNGCEIYDQRPGICRAYRCLWLRGKLRDQDRPDRLGAVLDLVATGPDLRLSIRQASPDSYDRSSRLQEIAEDFRAFMPVRITDVDDVLDPDRPFRVLLPGGEEQLVAGEEIRVIRDGIEVETRRAPWPQRVARRITLRWRATKLRRIGSG
jgi:Fe-S-cluster containining protein